MAFRLLARKVFTTAFNVCATTTIGTGTSGVAIVTKLASAVEAIQFYNGTTSTIALCTGTTAAPVVKMLCGPGLSDVIPADGLFPSGAAVIAVAQDAAATSGTFAVNFLAG